MALRDRIMEYLTDWGPATVAQLVEDFDAEPPAVRSRLRQLEWEQAIYRAGKVPTKTRRATLWAAQPDSSG